MVIKVYYIPVEFTGLHVNAHDHFSQRTCSGHKINTVTTWRDAAGSYWSTSKGMWGSHPHINVG